MKSLSLDDDNKKEYCEVQIDQSDDTKKSLEKSLSDTEATMATAKEAIATLADEIAALNDSIKALDRSVADAIAQNYAYETQQPNGDGFERFVAVKIAEFAMTPEGQGVARVILLAAEQWGAMSFDSKELFKKEVEEEAEVEEDANEDGKTQRRRFSPSRLTSPLNSPAA